MTSTGIFKPAALSPPSQLHAAVLASGATVKMHKHVDQTEEAAIVADAKVRFPLLPLEEAVEKMRELRVKAILPTDWQNEFQIRVQRAREASVTCTLRGISTIPEQVQRISQKGRPASAPNFYQRYRSHETVVSKRHAKEQQQRRQLLQMFIAKQF